MLTTTLKTIFDRDLQKLCTELESYKTESNIWRTDEKVSNSAGNLCLHLIGNLNWFVGAQLGYTGYVRNREEELTLTNIPLEDLITQVENTRKVVRTALDQVTPEQLKLDYPIQVFKHKMTTSYFLVHLTTHLAYHVGQINYHRRLLEE